MLQLFTDTDCDVTPQIAAEYGYKLISMPYSINAVTYFPYEDSETIDFPAFYNMLRNLKSDELPSTSAISEETYVNYFEPVFKNGDDILYVHFSAAMSATFDSMQKALEKLYQKYPERKFYSLDAKGISSLGLVVVREVGKLYKEGKSVEEIMQFAKDEIDNYAMYFFADDLKFFKKSGRVSGLAAMLGTIIGIRPIIHINAEGKMVSIGKEKGRIKAMERLVSYVEELGDDIKNHPIVIGHTDSEDIAKEIASMIREKLGQDLEIEIVTVNPTAGCHCGPNGVGVAFHAIHR